MQRDRRLHRGALLARRHPAVVAIVAYVVVAVAVLFPALRPGRTTVPADILTVVEPWHTMAGGTHVQNPIVSDAALQFAPWWQFLRRELVHGHVPQWNPDLLGGVPVTPNGYVSVYYPPFWLGRWLSVYDAYDVFILLHLVLAATGIYALCRVIGCRVTTAWLSGLGAMAAAMWVHWSLHLVHLVGMTWLPLVLAAALVTVRRPSAASAASLAAAFGLWWLGANPQYAYYGTLCLAGVVGLALVATHLKDWRRGLVAAMAVLGGLGLGAIVAAPVLLPSATSSSLIVRQREPLTSYTLTHLAPRDRILAVLPDAAGNAADHVSVPGHTEGLDSPFFGVTGLALAVSSLAARRRPNEWWFLTLAVIVAVVLGTTATIHPVLRTWLPGYDRFRQSSRWLAVLPAVALPLAAVAWDRLREGDKGVRVVHTVTAGVLVVACGVWYLHHHHRPGMPVEYFKVRIALTTALLVVAVGAGWAARRFPRTATTVVAACVLFEVAFHTPRWYPSVVKTTAYPSTTVARIARARGGRIVRFARVHDPLPAYTPDVPLFDGVADSQGQAVLFPTSADRYLHLIDDYGQFAVAQNTAPALIEPRELGSPLLDALDVRTIVVGDRTDVPPAYGLLAAGQPAVYGRTSLGPAVVVPHADVVSKSEMWRRVANPTWRPAATAAVVGLARPVNGGLGSVRPGRRGTDHDEWLVDAPSGGFLRVSAAWAKGWTATIDGRRTPVLLADGLFRGVVVPVGHHRVQFAYHNPAESTGRFIAGGGLLAIAACLLAGRVSRRRGLP